MDVKMAKLILNIDDDLKNRIAGYADCNNVTIDEVTEQLWVDLLKTDQFERQLQYYQDCFDRLNCSYNKNLGYAPHKPILLMSVIKLFENRHYTSSELKITPQLESMFQSQWKKFVTTNHVMNLATPFYHLKNEPFWRLTAYQHHADVNNQKKIRTLSNLKKTISHATIDRELTGLLLNEQSRTKLYEFLVWRYFDNQQLLDQQENLLSKFKNHLDDKIAQFSIMFDDLWLPKVA